MEDGWIPVCPLQGSFPGPGSRRVVEVPQGGRTRKLLLIRTSTGLSCMDAVCGHAGGPLYEGDIENLGDACLIRCPWHMYEFDVRSGKQVVEGCLGNQYQRIHPVNVRDGMVYVKILPRQLGTIPCPSERFSVVVEPPGERPRGQKRAGPAAAFRARRRQMRQTTLPFTQVKASRAPEEDKVAPLAAGGLPVSSGSLLPVSPLPQLEPPYSHASQAKVSSPMMSPLHTRSPIQQQQRPGTNTGPLGPLLFSMSQESTATNDTIEMDLDVDSDTEISLSRPYHSMAVPPPRIEARNAPGEASSSPASLSMFAPISM